ELWILIHFEEVDVHNLEYQHRSKYYERLTALLKTSLASELDGSRIVNNQRFSYKETMKTENKFVRFTLQLLKGKTEIAMQRAKILEAFHNSATKPFHEKSPCTMVHHLCTAILDAGGREI
ncbi:MAG TPA: RloB domain-containing protein, partial [Bacteroidia bacterium]|nr:RloB domain-containing protein [Bacteroidia bacterium]